NEIWQVQRSRSLFRRFIFFWTFCTLGAFMLTIVLGFVSRFDLKNFIPYVESDIGSSNWSQLVTAGATFLFFIFLYKLGPNCRVKVVPAAVGAAVSMVLIRAASAWFTFYAANNKFYTN